MIGFGGLTHTSVKDRPLDVTNRKCEVVKEVEHTVRLGTNTNTVRLGSICDAQFEGKLFATPSR